MLRNMVTSLIEHERIETTDAKAKELRSVAERLVTLAKRGNGSVAARRRAARVVRDRKLVKKLFEELAPRYADRPGGYTRIVKVETRLGDSAPLSILQFVTEPVTFKERKPKAEEPVEPVRRRPEEPAPPAEGAVEAAEAAPGDAAKGEGE